jgi:hypothetical protein
MALVLMPGFLLEWTGGFTPPDPRGIFGNR